VLLMSLANVTSSPPVGLNTDWLFTKSHDQRLCIRSENRSSHGELHQQEDGERPDDQQEHTHTYTDTHTHTQTHTHTHTHTDTHTHTHSMILLHTGLMMGKKQQKKKNTQESLAGVCEDETKRKEQRTRLWLITGAFWCRAKTLISMSASVCVCVCVS